MSSMHESGAAPMNLNNMVTQIRPKEWRDRLACQHAQGKLIRLYTVDEEL